VSLSLIERSERGVVFQWIRRDDAEPSRATSASPDETPMCEGGRETARAGALECMGKGYGGTERRIYFQPREGVLFVVEGDPGNEGMIANRSKPVVGRPRRVSGGVYTDGECLLSHLEHSTSSRRFRPPARLRVEG
jgi:hypothetical protein